MRPLVVGTRRGQLAITQTNWVIDELKKVSPDLQAETKVIITQGDKLQRSNIPLFKVGGKGLFLKEIEKALLDGEIDLAVHSMKDVPAEMPPGLVIGCIPERVDARDCLISKDDLSLDDLPTDSVIGTSSLRRQSQLLAYRSDLTVEPLRGNIGPRIEKMQKGLFSATVLATAGLVRVGWAEKITQRIPVNIMTPAIGQGALVVECREDDQEMISFLKLIHHPETAKATLAERAFQKVFQGGCHLPLAAHGENINGRIRLTGLAADPEGEQVIQGVLEGSDEIKVGSQLAQQLMDRGAKDIIDRVNRSLAHET